MPGIRQPEVSGPVTTLYDITKMLESEAKSLAGVTDEIIRKTKHVCRGEVDYPSPPLQEFCEADPPAVLSLATVLHDLSLQTHRLRTVIESLRILPELEDYQG